MPCKLCVFMQSSYNDMGRYGFSCGGVGVEFLSDW
jgi:hypothetical protein